MTTKKTGDEKDSAKGLRESSEDKEAKDSTKELGESAEEEKDSAIEQAENSEDEEAKDSAIEQAESSEDKETKGSTKELGESVEDEKDSAIEQAKSSEDEEAKGSAKDIKGKAIQSAVSRKITKEDVKYIQKNSWPSLELEDLEDPSWQPFVKIGDDMVNLNAGEYGDIIPISSTSGWMIYYQLADNKSPAKIILSSAGAGFGKHPDVAEELDHTGENIDPAPYATTQKQGFLTISEVLRIIFLQKWSGVRIRSGERSLQWIAWALAEVNDFPCEGFQPSAKDKKVLKVAEYVLSHEKHRFNSKPGLGKTLSKSGSGSSGGSDEDET